LTISSKDAENLELLEDPENVYNLPERTLTAQADMREFKREYAEGYIPKVVETSDGRTKKYKLVTLRDGDPENPKNWPLRRKWVCTMTVGWVCFAVAFASAVITPGIDPMAAEFGVSSEVGLLSITLFVIGFGVGRKSSPWVS